MTADRVWTREQVEALGVRVPGPLAMEILYGVGRTKAHMIIRSGAAGVKVIHVPGTNRTVVPTSELIRLLDLADRTPDP